MEKWWQCGGNFWTFALQHSHAHQWIGREVIVWDFASKYLVQNHPIGEHITHFIDICLNALHNFRCHPAIGAFLGCHGCLGHGASCAEVTDFC